jgi:hypothetical protein
MLSVMVLYTKYTKGQDYIIHDNSLLNPDLPTSFIQTNPYPSTPSTICSLEIGKSFRSLSYRGIFYGGNLGIAQSPTNFGNAGGKWSFTGAWRRNYTWPLGASSVSPGIDYLVNYHRWGNYSAHFGLREVTTFVPIPYGEGTPIPPDLTQKDAVITWSYEIGQPANRLIFQSIEGTDITTVAAPSHIAKEWATILSNGNIGSGTSNPTAQFQLKPLPSVIGAPLIPLMEMLDNTNVSKFRFTKSGYLRLGDAAGTTITAGTVPQMLDIFGNVKIVTNSPDVSGTAALDVTGLSQIQSPASQSNNPIYKNFVIKNWNGDEKIFTTDDGRLFLMDYAGTNDELLYVTPFGEVKRESTGAGFWNVSGNNFTGTQIFGTNSQTDISLKAGGVNFGKINGATTGYEGIVNFTKSVSISGGTSGTGFPNGGVSINDHNYSLSIISSVNTGNNSAERGILNCLDNNQLEVFRIGNAQMVMFGYWDNPTGTPVKKFKHSLTASYVKFDAAAGIDLYGGDVTVEGNILPKTTGIPNIGSSSKKFNQGHFDGLVYSGGSALSSDKRLKENIKPIENTLEIIKKLNPVKFNFISKPGQEEYGFIAQELEPLLPNVVLKPKNDIDPFYVLYSTIIPVLTKGMQEQQMIIDSLKQKLDLVFASGIIKDTKNINNQKEELNQLPILFQNHPNPFNGITFIDYFLPINTNNAFIRVIDNNGKLVKAFPINQTGFGQIELDCTNLASGQYHYSLVVNSQIIDTKSMIIATID